MTSNGPLPPPTEPSAPQPGSLGIKEKRSWQTWQFIAAIVIAGFIGMAIGHSGGGSSGAAGGAGGGNTLRTLPPDNATATTLAGASGASGPATTIGGDATATTIGSDATATTVAGASGASGTSGATGTGGATTTTAPAGPQTYLVHNLQGTGPSNLPSFTIAGGDWSIGWAYRCVLAPGGAAKFQITGGTAKPVDEQGREGSGTTTESAAGHQVLNIVTDPACAWAVTVVGVAG